MDEKRSNCNNVNTEFDAGSNMDWRAQYPLDERLKVFTKLHSLIKNLLIAANPDAVNMDISGILQQFEENEYRSALSKDEYKRRISETVLDILKICHRCGFKSEFRSGTNTTETSTVHTGNSSSLDQNLQTFVKNIPEQQTSDSSPSLNLLDAIYGGDCHEEWQLNLSQPAMTRSEVAKHALEQLRNTMTHQQGQPSTQQNNVSDLKQKFICVEETPNSMLIQPLMPGRLPSTGFYDPNSNPNKSSTNVLVSSENQIKPMFKPVQLNELVHYPEPSFIHVEFGQPRGPSDQKVLSNSQVIVEAPKASLEPITATKNANLTQGPDQAYEEIQYLKEKCLRDVGRVYDRHVTNLRNGVELSNESKEELRAAENMMKFLCVPRSEVERISNEKFCFYKQAIMRFYNSIQENRLHSRQNMLQQTRDSALNPRPDNLRSRNIAYIPSPLSRGQQNVSGPQQHIISTLSQSVPRDIVSPQQQMISSSQSWSQPRDIAIPQQLIISSPQELVQVIASPCQQMITSPQAYWSPDIESPQQHIITSPDIASPPQQMTFFNSANINRNESTIHSAHQIGGFTFQQQEKACPRQRKKSTSLKHQLEVIQKKQFRVPKEDTFDCFGSLTFEQYDPGAETLESLFKSKPGSSIISPTPSCIAASEYPTPSASSPTCEDFVDLLFDDSTIQWSENFQSMQAAGSSNQVDNTQNESQSLDQVLETLANPDEMKVCYPNAFQDAYTEGAFKAVESTFPGAESSAVDDDIRAVLDAVDMNYEASLAASGLNWHNIETEKMSRYVEARAMESSSPIQQIEIANKVLLAEIESLNRCLIGTRVELENSIEYGETIVICTYKAVASLNGDGNSPVFPLLKLRLIVPADYPKVSPIILNYSSSSNDQSELSIDLERKTHLELGAALLGLYNPISLERIAKSWETSAHAVLTEYAQSLGGGSFGTKYGSWETC